jgi:hypothetical protein
MDHDLSYYAEILNKCLELGGITLLDNKENLIAFVKFVKEEFCNRVYTFSGPLVRSLLAGLTNIYTISCLLMGNIPIAVGIRH